MKGSVPKFIYFSTTDVYDASMSGQVAEHSASVSTGNIREMTMRSGEDLVLRYKTSTKTKFTILRCSDIYGECNGQFYMDSFFIRSLKTSLMNQTVFVEHGRSHNMIHVQDVAEALVNGGSASAYDL